MAKNPHATPHTYRIHEHLIKTLASYNEPGNLNRSMSFVNWIDLTTSLQANFMADGDPVLLEGEAKTHFIQWNALAAITEIAEMLDEVGWKPWATSRHVNADRVIEEIVDVMHFLGDILRAVDCDGHQLTRVYLNKNLVNAGRQVDGYDGVMGKCPNCHTDLTEADPLQMYQVNRGHGLPLLQFCTQRCADVYCNRP